MEKSENSTQLTVFTTDIKLHVWVHFLPGHLYLQEGLEDQAVQEGQYYPGDPVKVSQECKLSQSHLEWTTKGHTLKQMGQNLIPRTHLAWWKRIIWCKLGWSKVQNFKQNLIMNLLLKITTEITYRVSYPPVPQLQAGSLKNPSKDLTLCDLHIPLQQ